MNKKTVASSVIAALIIIGAGTYYFSPTQINIETEEGQKTTQELITGTWLHSDTTCKGFAHYESAREFNIGTDLPTTTISAIRLDKDIKSYSRLEEGDINNMLNSHLISCEGLAESTERPIVINHDNFNRSRTFYFYPDTKIILTPDENNLLSLIKKEAFFELPLYSPVTSEE